MIPVSRPSLTSLERDYLLEAFDSGWISSRGAFIERAERELAAVTGVPDVAVTSNGTTALHAALLALGVGPGDEVVIPSLTYVATMNTVLQCGATPVVVDVDDRTWCLDPAAVADAVTARTRALVPVDLYGHPAPYGDLRRAAPDAVLLVDAAESIGATVDGRPAAALADVATFSFFGNKVVTSGEGGAVVATVPGVVDRVRQLRNQGNHPTRRYVHDVLGYNYRMTNLSAAVLTAQLERLQELVDRRRAVVDRYRRALADVAGIVPQDVAAGVVPSPWMFSVRLVGASDADRDRAIEAMATRGVETRPVFAPVQSMPYATSARAAVTPVSDLLGREGLSLPTYPEMTSDDVDAVVAALRDSIG